MSWTNAVITDAGYRLQAALLGTGKGLVFTRAVTGAGLAEGELAAQTAVTDERQTLSLQPATPLEDAKTKVQVLLSNAGLESGYTMHQLGFYAKAQDAEEEILYALVQDETDGMITWDKVGAAGGVAPLGPDGKVPEEHLPEMEYDPAGSAEEVQNNLHAHTADTSQHLSDGERAAWNAKGTPYHTQLTLTTGGWSGSGPYTQTVTATGITSDLTPVADVVLSSDTAAAKLQLEAWGCVSRMETLNGQVKATCLEKKPGVNLTVQLVGCKGGSV